MKKNLQLSVVAILLIYCTSNKEKKNQNFNNQKINTINIELQKKSFDDTLNLFLDSSFNNNLSFQKKIFYLEKLSSINIGKDSCMIYNCFFNLFPNNFLEFEKIYTYSFKSKNYIYKGPLGLNAEKHIDSMLFLSINCIDKYTYYSKLINISINGRMKFYNNSEFLQNILYQIIPCNLKLT